MKKFSLSQWFNETYLRHVQWFKWRQWRIRRFLSKVSPMRNS